MRARFTRRAFPKHAHAEYVIGAILSGAERFRHAGATHIAPQGSLLLLNPDEAHTGEPARGEWGYVAFYPSEQLCADWWPQTSRSAVRFNDPVAWDACGHALIWAFCNVAISDASALAVQSAFACVGAHLSAHSTGEPQSPKSDRRVVQQLKEMLTSDVEAKLTLADLAGAVGRTPLGVLRLFQHDCGCTPQLYRTARRIAVAKNALRNGAPLADAALAAGFCDQSHFTRVFRRWTGVTPGAFSA